MAALTQHTLLGGRYRLASRIAVGGMGEVWRAEDELLGRHVAVKVLKSELTTDPTFLARFRSEARTTASLSHDGIASVYDYGEVGLDTDGDGTVDVSAAYLVMELVDGEPLSAILAREGRLRPDRTLDIVGQAATALEAAHRTGMVHRDVKPGNLLVCPDGTVKITDFGIARVADRVPLTQRGMVVGTAQYFSPEQAEGRVVGAASDVYSLGVVAYECLAGRLPFVADSPVTVALMQIRDTPPPLPADVPPAVHGLVAQAMAKDPRCRFSAGGDFANAVKAVLGAGPPTAAAPHLSGPLPHLSGPLPHLSGPLPHLSGPLPQLTGPPPATGTSPYPVLPLPAGPATPPRDSRARLLAMLLVGLLGLALITVGVTVLLVRHSASGRGSPDNGGPAPASASSATTSAGPTSAGPTSAGPTSAGPTSAGPTSAGPTPSATSAPSAGHTSATRTTPVATPPALTRFIGQPAGEATRALRHSGYRVTTEKVPGAHGRPGTVTGIQQRRDGSLLVLVARPAKHTRLIKTDNH